MTSRSQSERPVEMTIWTVWSWASEGGETKRYLTVVWLDRAQHLSVHVNVEAARISFMVSCVEECVRYQITTASWQNTQVTGVGT